MFEATNNHEQHRYEIVVDNWTAYVTYMETERQITLIATSPGLQPAGYSPLEQVNPHGSRHGSRNGQEA
jgi:hypothetical protein